MPLSPIGRQRHKNSHREWVVCLRLKNVLVNEVYSPSPPILMSSCSSISSAISQSILVCIHILYRLFHFRRSPVSPNRARCRYWWNRLSGRFVSEMTYNVSSGTSSSACSVGRRRLIDFSSELYDRCVVKCLVGLSISPCQSNMICRVCGNRSYQSVRCADSFACSKNNE